MPRGSVFYVATATTPAGYLYCDGTRIPTSGTFQGIAASLLQDLRTLLGTSYGATGTLPNLVNRFAGYSATPGNTGGSANATLVSHSHTVTGSTNQRGGIARWRPATPSPSVTHGGGDVILFDEGNVGDGEETDFNNGVQLRLDTRHTHTVSGTAGNQGSSATNKNLPPYLGMRPIIKY